jgi:hypothetical protein
MPATSRAQQQLFAIAEHEPGKLHAANKALAKLPKSTLHDFAATKVKKLPKRVHPAQLAIREHGTTD